MNIDSYVHASPYISAENNDTNVGAKMFSYNGHVKQSELYHYVIYTNVILQIVSYYDTNQ